MKDYQGHGRTARSALRLLIVGLTLVTLTIACTSEGGREMDLSWIAYTERFKHTTIIPFTSEVRP